MEKAYKEQNIAFFRWELKGMNYKGEIKGELGIFKSHLFLSSECFR